MPNCRSYDAERVDERRVGHQRREQLIAHDVELEGALAAAIRFERHRDRQQARPGAEPAGNRRGAILQ